MQQPDDELVENYESLREDRGWSVAQMADHIEISDPKLAAHYRAQAAGKKPAKDKADDNSEAPESKAPAKPKGRQAAPKSDG